MKPGRLARARLLHRIFCSAQYTIEVETPTGLLIARGQGSAAELAAAAEESGEVVRMDRISA